MPDIRRKKFLDTKYWYMFWAYQCFDQDIDRFLKDRITGVIERGINLRGDAAYFLLLNFDQMLFRVEGPYPPMVLDRPSERISASVREIYPADRLNNIFDIIMEQLTKTSPDDDGYSAHQVIRAIDGGWPEIIKYVLWE